MSIDFNLIYKIVLTLFFLLIYGIYIYFRHAKLENGEKRKTFLYLILVQMGCFLILLLMEHQNRSSHYLESLSLINLGATVFVIVWRIKQHRNRCSRCGAKISLRERVFIDIPYCKSCKKYPANSGYNPNQTKNSEFIETPNELSFIDWDNWEYSEKAVLCFIQKEGKVILIKKKTGMGAGKINAPGGRIEEGETPLEAAIRETEEEIGLTPLNLTKLADLHFLFKDGYSLRGYAFFATDYSGELKQTVEADPFIVEQEDIPYEKMWADDIEWLPFALEGKKVDARFIFDGVKIIDKTIVLK